MFTWKILDLFANENKLISVHYLIVANDGTNTVESEGNHIFFPNTVTKNLIDTVETDIIYWLEKDTTQDGINPIKLTIENQLKALNNTKKVDFPWLVGTFTIE